MLHLNHKFKPVMTEPVIKPDYITSVVPSIQSKGMHELISKIKNLKVI